MTGEVRLVECELRSFCAALLYAQRCGAAKESLFFARSIACVQQSRIELQNSTKLPAVLYRSPVRPPLHAAKDAHSIA